MAEPEGGYGGAGERGGSAPGLDAEERSTSSDSRTGYARSQARARMQGVRDQARQRAGELKEQATERAEDMAERAGTRISGIARALRRASDELRSGGDARLATMTDDFAGQVEQFGSYLESETPGRMVEDVEGMARSNPGLFVGGTFAAGLLLGRFLRSDEPKADVDVVFEPEGDWGAGGGPSGNGGSPAGWAGASTAASPAASPSPVSSSGYPIGGDRDLREMTPDVENVSGEHPSSPTPGVRAGTRGETPVATPITGHETAGPGIRTGSSGAAALDAGSAGPLSGETPRRDGRPSGGEEGR